MACRGFIQTFWRVSRIISFHFLIISLNRKAMDPLKSLAVRANESIGEALIKAKLADQEMIDNALLLFNDYVERNELKLACLIKILSWDLKVIDETTILDHLVENHNLGYCLIKSYNIIRENLPDFTINECWATMTLPFDVMEGVFFVTTTNYLSLDVVEHWQKRLSPKIIWYVSDLSSLTIQLETIEKRELKQLRADIDDDDDDGSSESGSDGLVKEQDEPEGEQPKKQEDKVKC